MLASFSLKNVCTTGSQWFYQIDLEANSFQPVLFVCRPGYRDKCKLQNATLIVGINALRKQRRN